MTKRVWMASAAFLGLTAVILLCLLIDSNNNRGTESKFLVSGTQDGRSWNDNYIESTGGVAQVARDEPCQPQRQIVFIKTHKTASSTTAGIFDLYAFKNNLTVVVPPEGQAYMDRHKLFQRDMITSVPKKAKKWMTDVGFNVFSSHARYNRPEMDAVVHDAKYVTILRNPASQFLSAFVYFHFDTRFTRKFDQLGRTYTNVLEEFLKDPRKNAALIEDHPLLHTIHNEQLFDLGLDTKHAEDWDAIDAHIAKLDKELDFVMITEYYDESLILLRDLMCWSTEDILYTRRMVRNSTSTLEATPETRRKINMWNAADTQLYDHFNRTLWQRIAEYGPTFQDELQKLRDRLETVTEGETGSHRKLVNKMARRMKELGILA